MLIKYRLKIKDNISASEASARARLELEEAEEKAQETLVRRVNLVKATD